MHYRWWVSPRRRRTPARSKSTKPKRCAPISVRQRNRRLGPNLRERLVPRAMRSRRRRSEEHTSELQSRGHLVCRLLLEKKNVAVMPGDAIRRELTDATGVVLAETGVVMGCVIRDAGVELTPEFGTSLSVEWLVFTRGDR